MNSQLQIALRYVNAERAERAMQLDRPGRLYPAEKRTAIKAAALGEARRTAEEIRSGRREALFGRTKAESWGRLRGFLRQNGHTEAEAAEIVAAMIEEGA